MNNTATCTITYHNGQPEATYASIQEAVAAILVEYPDALICDAGGFTHDADDTDSLYDVRSGRVALIWENEAESVNDDGARAIAEITM